MEEDELREDFEQVAGECLQVDGCGAPLIDQVEDPGLSGTQDETAAGPSSDPKAKSHTIRIGRKVAEERAQLQKSYDSLTTNTTNKPDIPNKFAFSVPATQVRTEGGEADIVDWHIDERDLFYKLQVFERPETTRFIRALDLLGDHWTAMIQEFWEVDEDREAEFNELVQFCRPNAGASIYSEQVWGSQVEDNRHVRFLVSGPDIAVPRKVFAGILGEEWTQQIREYWRSRKAKLDQKKVLGYLQSEGYGRDEILDDEGVPFSPPLSPDYRPSESPTKSQKGEVELDEISKMIENAQAYALEKFCGKGKEQGFEDGKGKGMPHHTSRGF